MLQSIKNWSLERSWSAGAQSIVKVLYVIWLQIEAFVSVKLVPHTGDQIYICTCQQRGNTVM